MPDCTTFRMDEKLLGRSFVARRLNPCPDNINVNNPKYNSDLKVNTVTVETYDTYEEWRDYILSVNEKNLKDLK